MRLVGLTTRKLNNCDNDNDENKRLPKLIGRCADGTKDVVWSDNDIINDTYDDEGDDYHGHDTNNGDDDIQGNSD